MTEIFAGGKGSTADGGHTVGNGYGGNTCTGKCAVTNFQQAVWKCDAGQCPCSKKGALCNFGNALAVDAGGKTQRSCSTL